MEDTADTTNDQSELNITSDPTVKKRGQTTPLIDISFDSNTDKQHSDAENNVSTLYSLQGSEFKTKCKVIILRYNLAYKHKLTLYNNINFSMNVFM